MGRQITYTFTCRHCKCTISRVVPTGSAAEPPTASGCRKSPSGQHEWKRIRA